MQIVIVFAGCLVFHTLAEVSADLEPEIAEEPSINNNLEDINIKKEKFSYLLSLLKSAITAEENNTKNDIKDSNTIETNEGKENISKQYMNKPKEDFEVVDMKKENETTIFGKTFDRIISKISTVIEKPKNTSQNKEMPSLIPIFKPKQDNKNFNESPKFIPKQSTKTSKSLDQVDLNLKNKPTHINIPCHRAVDILEMNPQEQRTKVQPNSNFIASNTNSNIQSKEPKPVTISANCKDLDESVRMEFKPKAITLMQLYGNILRKLTITVLVPYHIKISNLKT